MRSVAGAAAAAKGAAKAGAKPKVAGDDEGGPVSAASHAKALKEITKNVKRQETELVKNIREYYKSAPAPEAIAGAGAGAGAGSKEPKKLDVKVKRLKFSKQLHKKAKKGDYY